MLCKILLGTILGSDWKYVEESNICVHNLLSWVCTQQLGHYYAMLAHSSVVKVTVCSHDN